MSLTLREIKSLIKFARAENITSMKLDGFEFVLGEPPKPTAPKLTSKERLARLEALETATMDIDPQPPEGPEQRFLDLPILFGDFSK